ncbi:MAG: FAD:protein FMN transferase [Spirochaetaceae bacterium]|jgi:thiamine biosynthesis lipoprotein|nr:FAD:protein FMN transferase [Spirochaetaceae bacterium]
MRRFCYTGFILLLASCAPNFSERSAFVFGTICRIQIYESGKEFVFDKLFKRMTELDEIFSANREDSILYDINKNAAAGELPLPPELAVVLSRALDFAALSADKNGRAAFDPSIGVLVKIWNIGTKQERIPTKEQIKAALALVDWRAVELNKSSGTVKFGMEGMSLDLGAIAKGYAADEAVQILRENGVKCALVDFGGNIYALGKKRDGSAWKIGVQNPNAERGEYVEVVEVTDSSVVTSGNYERFFEEDGIRYHHILSTETGFPVYNGIVSVTVIAKNSMDADALSTSLFALGFERGVSLLKTVKDAKAIFIFEDGKIVKTGE